MVTQANWRDRLPALAGIAAVLSLAIGGSVYLIFNTLDRTSLFLLLLGAGLLAFYVVSDFENVARALRGRQTRYGGNTAAIVLIFIAIVGLLNFLAARHSYRFDLTATGEFSLSAQTVKIVKGLQQPVKVMAFFSQGDFGRTEAEDLLKEYRRQNDKIQYEFIDWEARPGDALRYQLQAFPALIFESDGRRQEVAGLTEQDFTSAIFKVSRGEAKKVAFSTGHGEPELNAAKQQGVDLAREGLEASNYQVETINLLTTSTIGTDVAALVINAPATALHEQEKKVVKEYLDRGGKVMVLVAPNRTADLSDFLQPYGLAVGNGLAIDAAQSLPNQPFVPVVTYFPEYSPVTRDLEAGQQPVLMPMATQITVSQQLPTGVSASRLLATTDRSWLATDDKDINYREGDVRGPLTLGVAVTADAKTPVQQQTDGQSQEQSSGEQANPAKTRLVVIGSADFATNMAIDAWPVNRQLFVNAVNWLAEEEDLIAIRPQPPVNRTIMLTGVQANLLVYSSAVFLPLIVAVAGAWVWWSRR